MQWFRFNPVLLSSVGRRAQAGLEPGEQGGSQKLLVLPKLESTFKAVEGSCDSGLKSKKVVAPALLLPSLASWWILLKSSFSLCLAVQGQVVASGICLEFSPLWCLAQGRSSSPALLAGGGLRPGAGVTQFAVCPSVARNFSSYMPSFESKVSTQQLSFPFKGWLWKVFFFTMFLPLRPLRNMLLKHSSQTNSISIPSSWQQCVRTT